MTQRDLQELEQAARAIVAVVERNRVSDETAEERARCFSLRFRRSKRKKPRGIYRRRKEKKKYGIIIHITGD